MKWLFFYISVLASLVTLSACGAQEEASEDNFALALSPSSATATALTSEEISTAEVLCAARVQTALLEDASSCVEACAEERASLAWQRVLLTVSGILESCLGDFRVPPSFCHFQQKEALSFYVGLYCDGGT